MVDIVSKENRSRNMSAIKSKNTKPEVYFRKRLYSLGYRYSISPKDIDGKPDIFLRKYNTAVFINGCFWHRHKDCKYAYTPKSNCLFWFNKFNDNIQRDQRVKERLKVKSIKYLLIWECTIRKMKKDIEYEKVIVNIVCEFMNSKDMVLEL